jgi:hypothetical protein
MKRNQTKSSSYHLMPLIKLMNTDKPTPLKYSSAESQPKEKLTSYR